jgi:hypothetical protein
MHGLDLFQLFPSPLALCDAVSLPPRSTRASPRNAIVGLGEGYNIQQLFPLVTSVRQVMSAQTTDILILTNTDANTAPGSTAFIRWAKTHNVTLIRYHSASQEVQQHGPLLADFGVFRFRYYEAIAQTRCHHGYLFIDVRDIFFQRDIFAVAPREWWDNSVVLTLEGRNRINKAGQVDMVDHNILNNPDHSLHMNMLRCMLNEKELASLITNQTMACSGVLGGGGSALRAFLANYNALAVAFFSNFLVPSRVLCRQRWIPDQMLMNYMMYNTRFSIRRLIMSSNEDGLVYHQRGELIRRFGDLPPRIMNEYRTKVSAVVHHFDRSAELVKYWERAWEQRTRKTGDGM